MSTLWRGLESLGNWVAVPAVWRRHVGGDFDRISQVLLSQTGRAGRWVPSRQVCGCKLRVVQHSADHVVGISECETTGCGDVKLSAAEIGLLELKWMKLARELAKAFGWDFREADTGVEGAQQIGTFGPESLPILLAVPRSQQEFGVLVLQLIGRFGGNFILLAPTNRFVDGNAQSALRAANAGFFALEGLVAIGADGGLQASRQAGELFAPFLPQSVVRVVNVPPSTAVRYLFQHAGSFWNVIFEGGPEFHIEDTLGAKYLAYLLHHPNEPISAHDLEIAVTPDKAKARDKNSIQRKLDPEAVKQYLRELNKLRAQRDEAVQDGDNGEAERLDGEIEDIEGELKSTSNPSDTGERARSNVNKAMAAVRKKLAKGDKHQREFGEHIERFVSIGYECVYNQEAGRVWG